MMTYKTFEIFIGGGKWIDVCAVDKSAAFADIRAAYGDDVEIITWSMK